MAGIPCGELRLTPPGRDLGEHLAGAAVYGAGSEVLAGIDVRRLHPARILLLAPVEEGALAAHELRDGIVDHPHVVLHRTADHGPDRIEPRLVARDLVDLVGRHGPDHAVRRDGPGAARTRILHDAAQRVDLAHQTLFRHLGLHVRHGQQDAVAHVARPHAAPVPAGAERRIGLDGAVHLVERKVVHGPFDGQAPDQPGIGRNIGPEPPALFDNAVGARRGTRKVGDDLRIGEHAGRILGLRHPVAQQLIACGAVHDIAAARDAQQQQRQKNLSHGFRKFGST